MLFSRRSYCCERFCYRACCNGVQGSDNPTSPSNPAPPITLAIMQRAARQLAITQPADREGTAQPLP